MNIFQVFCCQFIVRKKEVLKLLSILLPECCQMYFYLTSVLSEQEKKYFLSILLPECCQMSSSSSSGVRAKIQKERTEALRNYVHSEMEQSSATR